MVPEKLKKLKGVPLASWGVNGSKFAVAKNLSGEASLRVAARNMNTANSSSILWKLLKSDGTGNIGRDVSASSDITVDDDVMIVAIDNDENGIIDGTDPVLTKFNIGVVSPSAYENSKAALSVVAKEGESLVDYRLASSFLYDFVGLSHKAPIKPTDTVTRTLTDREIVNSLSHRAGAIFVPQDAFYDVCKTTVNNYVYNNNSAADILVDTQVIKKWYTDQLSNRFRQGFLQEGATNPISYPKPDDGIGFIGADKYTDAHFGIGRAKVDYLSGNATVVKKAGRLCVESVAVTAKFEDVYDYNYYAQGDVGELLSQRAAMLELGRNSGLNSGAAGVGEIFVNTFVIDKSVNLYTEYFDFFLGTVRNYDLCF